MYYSYKVQYHTGVLPLKDELLVPEPQQSMLAGSFAAIKFGSDRYWTVCLEICSEYLEYATST